MSGFEDTIAGVYWHGSERPGVGNNPDDSDHAVRDGEPFGSEEHEDADRANGSSQGADARFVGRQVAPDSRDRSAECHGLWLGIAGVLAQGRSRGRVSDRGAAAGRCLDGLARLMHVSAPCLCGLGGAVSQHAPLDIRAEVFAADRAARGPLDLRAALGRHLTIPPEPLTHGGLFDAQGSSQSGLTTEDFDGTFDCSHRHIIGIADA